MRPPLLDRLLIRLYPRPFRRRFESELLEFWDAQRAELRDAGGWWKRMRYVLERILDALRTGLRLRIHRRGVAGPGPVGYPARIAPAGNGGTSPGSSTGDGTLTERWGMGIGMRDVRYAARSLAGAPLHTLVAVLTLAVGVGANAAIFGIVNGVLLRPLPYDAPSQLFAVQTDRSSSPRASFPDFLDWQGRQDLFLGLAGSIDYTTDVRWTDEAEQVQAAGISHNASRLLGLAPILGRGFTEEEDSYGGPDAILISEGMWTRRFGRDPAVLGTSISVGGDPHTVVGVLPASFLFPEAGIDLWTPLKGAELLEEAGFNRLSRTLGFVRVLARVRPDVDPATVARALAVMNRRSREAEGIEDQVLEMRLQPLHELVVGDARAMILMVFGSVGLVLVVACANLAGLALTRAASRERELAVRAALGASRSQLVSQMVTESLLLASLGGLLGLGLAFGLTEMLVVMAPPGLPRLDEVGVDGAVLAFTGLVSLATGLGFGLVPAFRASRADAQQALASGSRGSTGGATRMQHGLVVGQVALAVALMTASALLTNSLVRLTSVDTGFQPENLMRVSLLMPSGSYEDSRATVAFYDRLLRRVRGLPGVDEASATYSPPLAANELRQSVVPVGQVEDPDNRVWVGTVIAQTRYFETVGVEIIEGRGFDGSDRPDDPPVAVVNEVMARQLWPDQDAMGQRFELTGGISGSVDRMDREFFPREPFTVVGVVSGVRRASLATPPTAEFYRPHAQMGWGSLSLMIRGSGPGEHLVQAVRQAVAQEDPRVAMVEVTSLGQLMSRSVATPRFRALLMGGFAAVACLLAMLGVYAVLAFGVERRTREIGIRMALGAPAPRVRRDVLARGLSLAVVGLLVGLAAAAAASRALVSMLFQVSPTDPATFSLVAVTVLGVAALACYLPARRASRVNPVTSLRAD